MFNQAKRISTFFTFNGNGEEAFNFYLDTFPDAKKSRPNLLHETRARWRYR